MASFLLWIYFLWVQFDFSMQIFQPLQCSVAHFCESQGQAETLFSYTHAKPMTRSIMLHFIYKTELQLPCMTSIKGNWMILTQ